MVGEIGDVDYRVEIEQGKVKTYHVKMLKQYYHRHNSESVSHRSVGSGKDLSWALVLLFVRL